MSDVNSCAVDWRVRRACCSAIARQQQRTSTDARSRVCSSCNAYSACSFAASAHRRCLATACMHNAEGVSTAAAGLAAATAACLGLSSFHALQVVKRLNELARAQQRALLSPQRHGGGASARSLLFRADEARLQAHAQWPASQTQCNAQTHMQACELCSVVLPQVGVRAPASLRPGREGSGEGSLELEQRGSILGCANNRCCVAQLCKDRGNGFSTAGRRCGASVPRRQCCSERARRTPARTSFGRRAPAHVRTLRSAMLRTRLPRHATLQRRT